MTGNLRKREGDMCEACGQSHHGGPGEQDCGPPHNSTEVKDYSRPLYPSDIRRAQKAARRRGEHLTTICAPGGWTDAAAEEAQKDDIALSTCGKRPRRS
jgi:hypothetical protein